MHLYDIIRKFIDSKEDLNELGAALYSCSQHLTDVIVTKIHPDLYISCVIYNSCGKAQGEGLTSYHRI
jgi:hypothetical protein